MGKLLLGISKSPISPHNAILFFVGMSIVFSLMYWLFFPLLEGTPSLSYGANRLSSPRSASFLDCLYFSVTTQTTVGYGDITPISVLGKVCTIIQAAFGYFYLAFLVSLFTSKAMMKLKTIQTYLHHTEETDKVLRLR
jgi:hypothetical protein